MQACDEVLALAGGDAFVAALNHPWVGGNLRAVTVQVDTGVYVVGQDNFDVLEYGLDCWKGLDCDQDEPLVRACADAAAALAFLDEVRRDRFVWQCGGCDSWVHTAEQPRIGVLPCHECADGGVDFAHARRHGDSA